MSTTINPDDALRAQAEIAAGWLTQAGAERVVNVALSLRGVDPSNPAHREAIHQPEAVEFCLALAQAEAEDLLESQVYALDRNIAEGLVEAAETLPECPFGVSMLPSPSGLVYLGGDTFKIPAPHLPSGQDTVRVLTWHINTLLAELLPQQPTTVSISLYVDRQGERVPHWRHTMQINERAEWAERLGGGIECGDAEAIRRYPGQGNVTADHAVRFLLTLGAFLGEKLVDTTPARPGRHLRKQLAREFPGVDAETPIQVVHLREVERPAERRGIGAPEWSCSWVVSSHWRKQWYPGAQEHRPKRVRAYIKGDTSKPLRATGARVRVIDR